MSSQTTPEPDERTAETKNSQQLLLLVLLLLVALFGYLYFFTGVIRPRPQTPPPQQAQTVVKKPLPPRTHADEGASKTVAAGKGKEKKGSGEEKGAQAEAAKEKKEGAKQAPAKEEKSAKAGPAKEEKPAKAAAKEEKGGKSTAASKDAKPSVAAAAPAHAPAKAAVKEEKSTKAGAPAEDKTAKAKGAEKKGPAKEVAKAEAAKAPAAKKETKAATGKEAPAKKSAEKGEAAASGGYTVELAGDLLESEMGSVTAKLKKAGLTRIEKVKVNKGEKMHRLYLADFANHDEAVEELQRLKENAPDAFMLNEKGRYAVYAGSYMREKKAALEQDRLYDRGVKLLLKTATAPVAVLKVRAGCFGRQAAAEAAVQQLKKAGLEAKVVKAGK